MRRALALLFLLVFAATSDSAALCLASSSGIPGSHDCCPESVSRASVTTCCGMSRPDRDRSPASSFVSGSPVLVLDYPGLQHGRETFTTRSLTRSFTDGNAPSVPLYLQHLSLLI